MIGMQTTTESGVKTMKIEFSTTDSWVRMNGQTGRAPRGFVAAVENVAKQSGLAVRFLGWDGAYTHSVDMTSEHKALVHAEMMRLQAAGDSALAAVRRCPRCGHAGNFTTVGAVCDDCAA